MLGRAHLAIHATLAPQEGGGGLEKKRGWETRPLMTNVGRGLTNVGRGLTNVGRGLTNVGRGLTNCKT